MPRRPGLYRDYGRWRVEGAPIATVMLGSMLSALPIIAQSPVLPPFGLIVLLAWRLLCPELWPVWVGLPLGLFDDIMSGQPIGSAMCLWTLALILVDTLGNRLAWRDWMHDWVIAGLGVALGLLGGWALAGLGGGGPVARVLPQLGYSVILYPFVARLCAAVDSWRLP
jgi:rod shape-determining protein MreD